MPKSQKKIRELAEKVKQMVDDATKDMEDDKDGTKFENFTKSVEQMLKVMSKPSYGADEPIIPDNFIVSHKPKTAGQLRLKALVKERHQQYKEADKDGAGLIITQVYETLVDKEHYVFVDYVKSTNTFKRRSRHQSRNLIKSKFNNLPSTEDKKIETDEYVYAPAAGVSTTPKMKKSPEKQKKRKNKTPAIMSDSEYVSSDGHHTPVYNGRRCITNQTRTASSNKNKRTLPPKTNKNARIRSLEYRDLGTDDDNDDSHVDEQSSEDGYSTTTDDDDRDADDSHDNARPNTIPDAGDAAESDDNQTSDNGSSIDENHDAEVDNSNGEDDSVSSDSYYGD